MGRAGNQEELYTGKNETGGSRIAAFQRRTYFNTEEKHSPVETRTFPALIPFVILKWHFNNYRVLEGIQFNQEKVKCNSSKIVTSFVKRGSQVWDIVKVRGSNSSRCFWISHWLSVV